MKKLLVVCLFFFLLEAIRAEDNIIIRNPKKAAMLSLIVPGGGQYYNKNKSKALLFGTLELSYLSLFIYNYDRYKIYNHRKKRVQKSIDEFETIELENQLKDIEIQTDKYFENQQSYIWWFGFSIIASVLDAYVDANLQNFDDRKRRLHILIEQQKIKMKIDF